MSSSNEFWDTQICQQLKSTPTLLTIKSSMLQTVLPWQILYLVREQSKYPIKKAEV